MSLWLELELMDDLLMWIQGKMKFYIFEYDDVHSKTFTGRRQTRALFKHNFLNRLLTDLKIKSVYSPLCEHYVSDFTPLHTS